MISFSCRDGVRSDGAIVGRSREDGPAYLGWTFVLTSPSPTTSGRRLGALTSGRLHEQMVLDTNDAFHGLGRAHGLARLDRRLDRPRERYDFAVPVDVYVERVEA